MTDSAKLVALETECLRNLTSTKCWITLARATIAAKTAFNDSAEWANAVNTIFERSLRAIPYSYKLWCQYLHFRLEETKSLCPPNEWFQGIRDVYERALDKLPRMPLLWCAYLQFVQAAPSPRISMMRHLIARALEALPATQHHHIWKIATTWARGEHIPFATFRSIWRLYLAFKPSTETQRQYFALLSQRGDAASLLEECVSFVQARRRAAEENPAAEGVNEEDDNVDDSASSAGVGGLEKSPEFWETVQDVLQSANWVYTGDMTELDNFVAFGTRYAASPMDFSISYALWLYGQGRISEGRARLRQIMETAPDPETFTHAYRMAIEVEDQLLESFALNAAVQGANDATYHKAEAALFGAKGAALNELTTLSEQYSLWMNQCQLRTQPTNVALWLKRMELIEERVYAGLSSSSDCAELCQQAIAQCTTGADVVDCAVGELYDQFARILVNAGKTSEAATVLSSAAWHVRFASPSINVLLLGRLVELKLAFTCSTPADALSYLMDRLTAKQSSSPSSALQRRQRESFITTNKEAPLPGVQSHSLAWLLAVDVALSYGSLSVIRNALEAFANSAGYTAEAACYVAHGLFACGQPNAACAEMERSIARFHDQPVALTLVLSQYISLLSLLHGQHVPLHRYRELSRLALEIAPGALTEAPVASVELITACAAVEAQVGLYGHALDVLQQLCLLVLRHVDRERYTQLVEGTLETAIRVTRQLKGLSAMREVCARLLKAVPTSSLAQRVALQWAGMERVSGDTTKVHQVFDACAESQDPRTAHGAVYWQLWESSCTQVSQLEEVARRRQQVVTAYQKRT